MIWVILFIPVCIWLSMDILYQLNLISLGGITLTCLIYFLIELKQVSKDKKRDRMILWVMGMMLITMAVSGFI